jgi:hypothetical protein
MTRIVLLVSVLLTTLSVYSQTPYGFSLTEDEFAALSTNELATFDHAVLWAEDTRTEKMGGRTNVGRLIPIGQNSDQIGEWTFFPNGDKLWQYRFRTADAKGLSVYFNDLFIPEGASLYFYPSNRKYFLGPFNNDDSNEHGRFMAGEITGDEGIIEYFQPAAVVAEARLGIRAIAHHYRYVYNYLEESDEDDRGGAADCEVDVNCPEGDGWQAQRDAVVRLTLVDGNTLGYCSGAFVNNTAMDCKKYILTALHCGEGISDADFLDCSVRLNYQRSQCTTGSIQTSHNRIGVTHITDSNDGGGDSGSDFLLLELVQSIPASYNPFFAGWDATSSTPNDVVGIHHPSGDRKKISTATNIVSGTWQAPGNHWQVKWMETVTNWGVTEPGSSGSPIFNNNKRIVGQLTGGFSCCTDGGCPPTQFTGPAEPDYYGKMDKNWDDNPNSASEKLKNFLDPLNTGVTAMDGSYVNEGAQFPCSPAVSAEEIPLAFDDVKLFPSLTDQELNLNSSRFRQIREIKIFDAAGQLNWSGAFGQENIRINTAEFAAGVYYITFVVNDGSHLTKKFVVQH